MVKDTKRDRVWRAILELGRDPPTYRLEPAHGGEVVGFGKVDVRLAVDGDSSERTVHDVIQTAREYGLIEMVKEPPYASVRSHPVTGEASQMDLYRLTGADQQNLASRDNSTKNLAEKGSSDVTNDRTDPEPDTTVSNETEVPDDLAARIRALDVPGSGSRLDDRVAAAVRLVEYLEAEGEATAEELKALLDDDAVGYADVGSYWANWIRGAGVLKAIAEVEAPGKGEKVYRHRTDR